MEFVFVLVRDTGGHPATKRLKDLIGVASSLDPVSVVGIRQVL